MAEFLGTAYLLAAIIGSGAMAERLTDDVGLQLLQNAVATSATLAVVIMAFAPSSGAHFNPAVTLTDRLLGRMDTATAAAYVAAQVVGAICGVVAADVMFDLGVHLSTTSRSGAELLFAEAVATLGLLLVIHGVARSHGPVAVGVAVGGYIAGAFAFTSSTSFANPAVTVARMFSDSFAGIEPASVPGFVVVQLAVAMAVVPLVVYLWPDRRVAAAGVVGGSVS